MPDPAIRRSIWVDFAVIEPGDLYAMLRLRCDVFVVEQRCAYRDIDGLDPWAWHFLVWLDDGGPLSGCLRVFPPGDGGIHARIGRVAAARAARGRGLGRWMMREALAFVDRRFPEAATEIGGQVAAAGFYEGLGFERVSADYDEDGIPHCLMRRPALGGAALPPGASGVTSLSRRRLGKVVEKDRESAGDDDGAA